VSWAILLLGALAFADVASEPTRARRASREALFTALGERFVSFGLSLLLLAFAVLAALLLSLGGWTLLRAEAGSPGDAAPAIGFGLFFLACALGGAPREPHLFFGESRLRVGGRRLAYEAFAAFAVEGNGSVVLEGKVGRLRGRVTPSEVEALRAFLAERVFLPPDASAGT
jgi:hypothetical protein